MNKHLATDMADANGQQRAIRPTAFFNIKKMAAEFCSAQCIMDDTGSLNFLSLTDFFLQKKVKTIRKEDEISLGLSGSRNPGSLAPQSENHANRPTDQQTNRPTDQQANRPTGQQANRPTGRCYDIACQKSTCIFNHLY